MEKYKLLVFMNKMHDPFSLSTKNNGKAFNSGILGQNPTTTTITRTNIK